MTKAFVLLALLLGASCRAQESMAEAPGDNTVLARIFEEDQRVRQPKL